MRLPSDVISILVCSTCTEGAEVGMRETLRLYPLGYCASKYEQLEKALLIFIFWRVWVKMHVAEQYNTVKCFVAQI